MEVEVQLINDIIGRERTKITQSRIFLQGNALFTKTGQEIKENSQINVKDKNIKRKLKEIEAGEKRIKELNSRIKQIANDLNKKGKSLTPTEMGSTRVPLEGKKLSSNAKYEGTTLGQRIERCQDKLEVAEVSLRVKHYLYDQKTEKTDQDKKLWEKDCEELQGRILFLKQRKQSLLKLQLEENEAAAKKEKEEKEEKFSDPLGRKNVPPPLARDHPPPVPSRDS